MSIGLHTTAIALAIVATARATAAPREPSLDPTDLVFAVPVLKAPTLPIARRVDDVPGNWVPPRTPEVVLSHLPSTDIPRLDFSIDPAGALTKPLFDGAKPLAPCFCGHGADGSSGTEGGPYTALTVEKAAMPRPGNPPPTYPAILRAAQLEGSVTARFIVDTLGRAEPASITFPEASHAAFAEAVRQSLLHSRYLPAMVAGHAVRQLVEQRFTFALHR